jgi:hypothetical protein
MLRSKPLSGSVGIPAGKVIGKKCLQGYNAGKDASAPACHRHKAKQQGYFVKTPARMPALQRVCNISD